MIRFATTVAALAMLGLSACSNIELDPGEGIGELPVPDGPTLEFDPGASIVPFPNNLLISPLTGKVTLPAQCNESPTQTGLRAGVLNTLDGFGTFKPALQFTSTEAVDAASLAANVRLIRRATGTVATDPATETAIPVVTVPSMTVRNSADCASQTIVPSVIVVPTVPLRGNSTYVVSVGAGVTTAGGEAFLPSSTWALIRQATNPVTIVDGVIVRERTPLDPITDAATLFGLDLLWRAHAQAVAFTEAAGGPARADNLLTWEFTTQTTTAPVDPNVSGSLAAGLSTDAPLGIASITGGNTQAYLEGALGAPTCAAIGCDQVGDVLAGAIPNSNYQVPGDNPLAGGDAIPGPWSDPVSPTAQQSELLGAIMFVPDAPAPPNGYPVIVFGHGLGGSRNNLFAFAPQLARAGFASISIDFVAHGSRAVQNSDAAALGCGGTPSPSSAPQCFAPFLSANLAATRDNFRQTVLDLQRVLRAVKSCTGGACGAFDIDPSRVGYAGISLGGIMGSMTTAMSDDIIAAVLNVPGAGLVDLIENTDTLAIRCSLVNSLIEAGVVVGEPWNPIANTGICLTEDWKTQPGYRTFANAARWVLDPGDPANYTAALANRHFLLQMVTDDAVVPNITTLQLGAFSGLSIAPAAIATGAQLPPPPTTDLVTNPDVNHWLEYTTLPADAGSGFPGNTYQHASLLAPANTNADGLLATQQLQVDAITFLAFNLVGN